MKYKFRKKVPDLYFITLIDKPGYFLHYEGEISEGKKYVVKKGLIGAAMWECIPGNLFIINSEYTNLKLIHSSKVLHESKM